MIFAVEELVHIEGETVALAVVIVQTSYTKGLIFEVDLVEMLKSIGGKVIYKGRSGDGGIDIIYEIATTRFIIQCKNWVRLNIGRPVVDELLGVLTRTKQLKGTIGIIVSPSMDSFTPGAINAILLKVVFRNHLSLYNTHRLVRYHRPWIGRCWKSIIGLEGVIVISRGGGGVITHGGSIIIISGGITSGGVISLGGGVISLGGGGFFITAHFSF
ncbi:hypothetical protein F8M41_020622 [Gigaspora margarita]|uniref:Restriction endonuclease type IV Mrr domain-containing protein n=1 Tax=Gigaspora margarita TaxID=4874 RepID=A0A8H4EJQ2_GIGMA|nr:hypothetical protein F8M41_020622 [Gigaspora margarita]